MDIQQASIILATVAAVGTIIWFLIISVFNVPAVDFFYGERKLNRSNVRSNLAATATSLAGALFFFMEQISAFAIIMLAIPLLTFLGYRVFERIVGSSEPDPAHFGSIKRLIIWKTGSLRLARISNFLVIFNFISVFLIEIIIGAKIFSYLFGSSPLLMTGFSFSLCIIVLFYVLRGGFSAVVFTDRWQFLLLTSAYFLTFISVIYLFISSDKEYEIQDVLAVFGSPKVGIALSIMFAINAIVINLTLPSSQISTWQRYCSASSVAEAKEGFRLGPWLIASLWYVAIITSAFIVTMTNGLAGIDGMFDTLRTGSAFTALVVFPAIFAGLLAALLSTADSFMISTMLAADDIRDSNSSKRGPVDTKQTMLLTGIAMVCIAVASSYIVASSPDLGGLIIQLLFAAYGIPCLIFPIIVFGKMSDISKRINVTRVSYALILGLMFLISSALYGIVYQNFVATFIGPVASIGIVAIGLYISIKKDAGAHD